MKSLWPYAISCVLLATGLTTQYIWSGKFVSTEDEDHSEMSLPDTQCHQCETEDMCVTAEVGSMKGARSCREDGKHRPYLSCQEIEEVELERKIGEGAVKEVHLARWRGLRVAYSSLIHPQHLEDFLHGAEMLRALQPHDLVIRLIGLCLHGDRPVIVTEYHQLGSADRINDILSQENLSDRNTVRTRFQLCLDYAQILSLLHSGPAGTRIMCDSNDVGKTLSQFLVTDDLRLVINDLDALPLVDRARGKLTKCGHRQLWGDFVAPEQLWPFDEREFRDADMPLYDEKTDIWKVPDVTDTLLGNVPHGDIIRLHLFKIHRQCKELNPTSRPTAEEVLKQYKEIFNSVIDDQ
ncbi:protein O-mannose kinase-like [Acanthaster planci]|uniref:Protein O-mannose kinase n=1 Tax=Acanthaster planci TaxID=133434 RepID=A0A8B7YY76_ACAPL|nr:protein O-mannose kinase-like [Acanthaster planci]